MIRQDSLLCFYWIYSSRPKTEMSEGYCGKDPIDMTDYESILLVGIFLMLHLFTY